MKILEIIDSSNDKKQQTSFFFNEKMFVLLYRDYKENRNIIGIYSTLRCIWGSLSIGSS